MSITQIKKKSIFASESDEEDINQAGKNNMMLLMPIYKKDYSPPYWQLKPEIWNELKFEDSMVLFNKKDSLEDVKKLATEREPVNMAMNRYYDRDKLKKVFGWKDGYYGRYVKNRQYKYLAPNIAIYAKTPVMIEGIIHPSEINVINVIGYAFDSVNQPDAKHFSIRKLTGNDLVKKYVNMWKYVFICAKMLHLKRIYAVNVGGNNFCPPHLRGQKYIEKVLKPSITLARQYVDRNKKIKVSIKTMRDFCIPYSFLDMKKSKLESTLFVNSWDPWSMVGNGNGSDHSFDGAWGNCSAIASLCWPLSNPHIKYVACSLDKKNIAKIKNPRSISKSK